MVLARSSKFAANASGEKSLRMGWMTFVISCRRSVMQACLTWVIRSPSAACLCTYVYGTYGPDLLDVYDIQEPIYNYLEDNILRIFPRFMENITPSVQKHLYITRSVRTHPLMTAFKRTLKP